MKMHHKWNINECPTILFQSQFAKIEIKSRNDYRFFHYIVFYNKKVPIWGLFTFYIKAF